MSMKSFQIQSRVCFGEDLGEFLKSKSFSQALVVTDPFMAQSHMVDRLIEALPASLSSQVYTDVQPDPSKELVERAVKYMTQLLPDVVIAFGGGSAIDAAKAMIYLAMTEHARPRPYFIAVPTTAGTGSEMTNFAVVTEGVSKHVLIDDNMYPDLAVLDYRFTKTVPPHITADTGMDVLTHALEAYVSKSATVFSDILALQAMKEVFYHLPIVVEDGLRTKSRKAMLEASCMAGMAFTNAGLGINHSLAHSIGGKFHLAHGRLNAIILPFVVAFNAGRSDEAQAKYGRIAQELGLGTRADDLVCGLERLNLKLGIPQRLVQLGKITAAEYLASLESMAEFALCDRCTPTNPVAVCKQDLVAILREVFE